MNKKLFFLLLFVSVAFTLSIRAEKQGNVSLLIAYCDKNESICNIQHVERLVFVNGDLISRKRIVSLNADIEGYATSMPQSLLSRNRHIYTVHNKIFDLNTEKFVGTLRPISEKDVTLPRLVSPDRTKSVYPGKNFRSTDKIEIHFADRRSPVIVEGDFQVTVASKSSQDPMLPLIWIDNERILTQKSNGNLVIVSISGRTSPFLKVPCTSEDFPSLQRNPSNKIVYQCRGTEYYIDVENARFEKIKRDLGGGFSLDIFTDTYYFNEKEIGKDGHNPVAITGYLAMLFGKGKDGVLDMATIKTIKVWNVSKNAWTTFTVDGWSAEIIGWLED